MAARSQREDSQAESRLRIALVLTEAQKFIERDLQLCRETAEHISSSSRAGTRPVSLRGVSGEDIGRRHHLERGIKIEMLLDNS